jgi:hypothetical protein
MERVVAEGRIEDLNALLRELTDNRHLQHLRDEGLGCLHRSVQESTCSSSLREDIRKWIEVQSDAMAGVADPRLDRASEIFKKHGPLIAVLLVTSSLVHAYAAPVGARTLKMTYRLDHDVRRRVGETAQFVLATMDPLGFSPDGMSLPSILKVRLLHATIRQLIKQWVCSTYHMSFGAFIFSDGLTQQRNEVPLSQEDQLGALMSFSDVVLEGLKSLGVRLSKDDQEAYLYHWCVVGRLLGVQPSLLPRNLDEAREARDAVWRDRAMPGNADGQELTRSLIAMLQDLSPDWFDGIVAAVVRKGVGKKLANSMDVPRDDFWDTVLDMRWICLLVFGFAPGALKGLVGDPVREATRLFLTQRLDGKLQEVPTTYVLPRTLEDQWTGQRPARMQFVHLKALEGAHQRELGARKQVAQTARDIAQKISRK